jgi:major membrane immunogen (membrane-anchored lipoprotein)
MKKYFKIGYVFILFFVLLLSGCGNKDAGKENSEQDASDGSDVSMTEKAKQGLLDLVSSGAGMKCTLEDPKMGQMTMYVKGEKAKVEGFQYMAMPSETQEEKPKEEKGFMLNDGTWVYIWSGAEGIKLNIKEMEEMAPKDQAQEKPQANPSDWKDWVKQMEANGIKYECNPSVLSDSDFTAPANVKFQDFGEMMKGIMKMGEEMKNNLPSQ